MQVGQLRRNARRHPRLPGGPPSLERQLKMPPRAQVVIIEEAQPGAALVLAGRGSVHKPSSLCQTPAAEPVRN
jgi:hypothetical protein